jgi:lipoyl(octanoyl) transferase
MIEHWYLSRSGLSAAARNMACDEGLLEAALGLAQPVVRLYGWTEPAATFGYFQKYAEVEPMTELRPLIRRPTGGGLVPHAADWTYSVIFPPTHPWYSVPAAESYQRIHQWIQAAFQKLDLQTNLSSACQKEIPGQCFAGAEKFDLICKGRKIAGAAQRRTRNGLLIQGSLQPVPPHMSRADWENAFCEVARVRHRLEWVAFEPSIELNQRVDFLVEQKYSQASYNQKR